MRLTQPLLENLNAKLTKIPFFSTFLPKVVPLMRREHRNPDNQYFFHLSPVPPIFSPLLGRRNSWHLLFQSLEIPNFSGEKFTAVADESKKKNQFLAAAFPTKQREKCLSKPLDKVKKEGFGQQCSPKFNVLKQKKGQGCGRERGKSPKDAAGNIGYFKSPLNCPLGLKQCRGSPAV